MPTGGVSYQADASLPGALPNAIMAEGEPPMAPEWRSWQNCPYIHQREH